MTKPFKDSVNLAEGESSLLVLKWNNKFINCKFVIFDVIRHYFRCVVRNSFKSTKLHQIMERQWDGFRNCCNVRLIDIHEYST